MEEGRPEGRPFSILILCEDLYEAVAAVTSVTVNFSTPHALEFPSFLLSPV